jgi:hypothetical protein
MRRPSRRQGAGPSASGRRVIFVGGLPRNSKRFAELSYCEDVPEQENPAICRASRERLMGLEPTTFCMASRRRSRFSSTDAGFSPRRLPSDYRRLPGIRTVIGQSDGSRCRTRECVSTCSPDGDRRVGLKARAGLRVQPSRGRTMQLLTRVPARVRSRLRPAAGMLLVPGWPGDRAPFRRRRSIRICLTDARWLRRDRGFRCGCRSRRGGSPRRRR